MGESADGTPLMMCSGSFIAKNKIITAAHCGELFLAPQVKVYTGDIEVTARSFKEHPSYNEYGLYSYQYDVGIVTLEKDVDITPLPILLSRQVVAGDDILVYGIAGVVSGGTTRTCQEGTLEVFTELDRQVILDFIYAEVPGVGAV